MTIEFLPNIKGSIKAILHDALDRSEEATAILTVWMDKNQEIHWSVGATNMECLWMIEKLKERLL